MFIRTERLFLRPGWPEERAELAGLILGVQGLSDEARTRIDTASSAMYPQFCITLPGEQGAQLIGGVELISAAGATTLEFWIAAAFRNQGFATEAVRAVLGLAQTLGHRDIAGWHFVEDAASGRVLGKAGFGANGQTRHCLHPVRDRSEPALIYAVSLDEPGNCDDPDGLMRAA
jgi:RimJ/RimL family protein N-acetyltransferase